MAQIVLTPNPARLDDDVRVRIIGLPAGDVVTVRAGAVDEAGRPWESRASFRTGRDGTVDLASSASLDGTYTGVDPNGMFWSMHLLEPGEPTPFVKATAAPLDVRLYLERDGKVLAVADLSRVVLAPGVLRQEVRAEGIVGTCFTPARTGPRPAVVVMSGSNGGLQEVRAALLASYGYVGLALAYFHWDGLPSDLCEIPLEYFRSAVTWLQGRTTVDADRICVMGSSRGGELALLLGATFSEIHAVIGVVPSAVVFGGIGADPSAMGRHAWTLGATGVPFLNSRRAEQDFEAERMGRAPFPLAPSFLRALEDADGVREATIAVERINGPVLLLSADDDQMWPSTLFSEMVLARLRSHDHPHPVRHYIARGAGHRLLQPYLPTTVNHAPHSLTGTVYAYGGTPAAHARGEAAAWREVLRFLDDFLG